MIKIVLYENEKGLEMRKSNLACLFLFAFGSLIEKGQGVFGGDFTKTPFAEFLTESGTATTEGQMGFFLKTELRPGPFR
jgi:hypothetical protein